MSSIPSPAEFSGSGSCRSTKPSTTGCIAGFTTLAGRAPETTKSPSGQGCTAVQQMVEAEELDSAPGNLRCLLAFLEKTHHQSFPRALRDAAAEAPSSGDTGVREVIDFFTAP